MATHVLASFIFLFVVIHSPVDSGSVLFTLPDLLEMYLPTLDEVEDLLCLPCEMEKGTVQPAVVNTEVAYLVFMTPSQGTALLGCLMVFCNLTHAHNIVSFI